MSDGVKDEVLSIMSQHPLCVISTVDEQAHPEAAIVGFQCNDDLELLVGTSNTTRKYKNLQQNPHVAITVGDFKAEVQYEGTAQELEKSELGESLEARFGKLPGIAKYQDDPTQTWLLITPTWLRLTVHETPNRIQEMSLA